MKKKRDMFYGYVDDIDEITDVPPEDIYECPLTCVGATYYVDLPKRFIDEQRPPDNVHFSTWYQRILFTFMPLNEKYYLRIVKRTATHVRVVFPLKLVRQRGLFFYNAIFLIRIEKGVFLCTFSNKEKYGKDYEAPYKKPLWQLAIHCGGLHEYPL